MSAREKVIQQYDEVLSGIPEIERKGKTMPYTSANGHMFSQINKDGQLGIRFSKEKHERYLKEWNAEPFKSYGAVMQGYVCIPENMWKEPEKIKKLLLEGLNFVKSLDPK